MFKGYKEISGRFWSKILNKAKVRNIEFGISIEEAWDRLLEQNKKCNLSGEDLCFSTTNSYKNCTASLDRIDSSLGYNKNNIQWIYKYLNISKNDFEQSYYLDTISRIYDHVNNGTLFDKALIDQNPVPNVHNKQWRGFGEISGTHWTRIRFNAKSRNMDFAISIEEAWNIFETQKRNCALSGQPLTFGIRDYSASLDRIDSDVGYIKSNIQWIHKDINTMKMPFVKEKDFLAWCKKMAIYNKMK